MTDSEVEQFVRRRLAGSALVVFADHLEGCGECRARVAARGDASAAFAALESAVGIGDDQHLAESEMAALVDGLLPAERRAALEAHLGECAWCAAEVEDLREFAATQRRRAFTRSRAAYGAVAAALVAGIALASLSLYRNRDVVTSTSPDGARVTEALAARHLSLPSSLSRLAGAPSALMGSVEQPRFRVVSPAATVVLANPPMLQWGALPGAAAYVVTLQDQSNGETISSPPLAGNRWIPARPLTPGRIYAWQVAALDGGRETIAPRPPDAPARFMIADASIDAQLRQLPSSALGRGVVYAEAGLLDDAEREFDRVPSADPAAATVAMFREQIRQARAPR